MFLLLGHKTKFKPLTPERRIRRRCPECDRTADLLACERVRSFSAFFVDVFDIRKTVWVCTACQEVADLPDALPDADADAEALELEATRQRQLADAAARETRRARVEERAQSVKQRVEDELAALKAKLGK